MTPKDDSFPGDVLKLFNHATHLLAVGDEEAALVQLRQIPSGLRRPGLGTFVRSKAMRLRSHVERSPLSSMGEPFEHGPSKFSGRIFAMDERLFAFRGLYAAPLATLQEFRSRHEWIARQSDLSGSIVVFTKAIRSERNKRDTVYGPSTQAIDESPFPDDPIKSPPRHRRQDAIESLGIAEGFRGIAWQESDRGRSHLTEIAISALYQVSGTVRWLEPHRPSLHELARAALNAVARPDDSAV